SRIRSGSCASISRCAAAPSSAQIGSKPLCRRFTAISSAIADSSSTTRTRGFFMSWIWRARLPLHRGCKAADARRGWSLQGGFAFGHRSMPHIGTLDDVDDEFGNVLGMVANALDGLGQEQQVEAW